MKEGPFLARTKPHEEPRSRHLAGPSPCSLCASRSTHLAITNEDLYQRLCDLHAAEFAELNNLQRSAVQPAEPTPKSRNSKRTTANVQPIRSTVAAAKGARK